MAGPQYRNPFESRSADWLAMADALHEAEERCRRAENLSVKLVAETEILHDQLAEANAERKFLMGYSVQIETRLDVITQTIQDAREEARKAAKRFVAERGRPPMADHPAAPQPQPERPQARLSEVQRPRPRQPEPPPAEEDDDAVAADLVKQISALHNKWP